MKRVFNNFRKPQGFLGSIIIFCMNIFHKPFSKWCLSFLDIKDDFTIIDLGCGGGKNVETFLKLCPNGRVVGVDFSKESVKRSISLNKKAIDNGKCLIVNENVANINFDFKADLITAFDTIYFWTDIEKVFLNIYKTLKIGGTFAISNEDIDGSFAKFVDDMVIYKPTYIESLLKNSGFRTVKTIKNNKKGWVIILAIK